MSVRRGLFGFARKVYASIAGSPLVSALGIETFKRASCPGELREPKLPVEPSDEGTKVSYQEVTTRRTGFYHGFML